jgi:hypothetical protein
LGMASTVLTGTSGRVPLRADTVVVTIRLGSANSSLAYSSPWRQSAPLTSSASPPSSTSSRRQLRGQFMHM